MLAVLIAVAFWLALATFLELPVSTSHSVGEPHMMQPHTTQLPAAPYNAAACCPTG